MGFLGCSREDWPISDERAKALAEAMGIDYASMPPWLNVRETCETLGLASQTQIRNACRDNLMPGAERYPAQGQPAGKMRYWWRIPRNGAVLYAVTRARGPQPRQGVPHYRPLLTSTRKRDQRGRKRKEVAGAGRPDGTRT